MTHLGPSSRLTYMSIDRLPTNLMEAIRHFSDPQVCIDFVAAMRWPNGPVCERCGSLEHSYLTTRRLWKCRGCKWQFSVKVGTIFEDSAVGLDKWLCAIWLIANSKNGVSSHELGRSIGVTQKTAWFMLQRIRLAMQTGTFRRLSGDVEVDESFIGGKARNMHAHIRARKVHGRGPGAHTTTVLGMVERDGEVRATVVPDRTKGTLHTQVRTQVEGGSALYTDEHHGYTGLEDDYEHETINHAVEYVVGQVHTNTIESFWALLKRGLTGTYISVQPYHLFRYLDERVYAYNQRDASDLGRFVGVLAAVSGRRLTYAELTGPA